MSLGLGYRSTLVVFESPSSLLEQNDLLEYLNVPPSIVIVQAVGVIMSLASHSFTGRLSLKIAEYTQSAWEQLRILGFRLLG